MSKSFGAPRSIRRIAARRVFRSRTGRPVVLTIGVPQPVSGSDWGCALQITGLNTTFRRPRFVFGIDGLQALHLAMMCATVELESAGSRLVWLGESGDLGLPKFLPDLPPPHQRHLETVVQREVAKWRRAERAQKTRSAKPLKAR
jgi:hypothetical protein